MNSNVDNGASTEEIRANLQEILASMSEASRRSGRDQEDTQLLAVSKTWPAEMVRRATECGQTHFGESRAQEVLDKAPAFPESLHWHFIGHLQKNKIRKILKHCRTLHSVDSLELAQQISRIAGEEGLSPDIYVQVNVAEDAAKEDWVGQAKDILAGGQPRAKVDQDLLKKLLKEGAE